MKKKLGEDLSDIFAEVITNLCILYTTSITYTLSNYKYNIYVS